MARTASAVRTVSNNGVSRRRKGEQRNDNQQHVATLRCGNTRTTVGGAGTSIDSGIYEELPEADFGPEHIFGVILPTSPTSWITIAVNARFNRRQGVRYYSLASCHVLDERQFTVLASASNLPAREEHTTLLHAANPTDGIIRYYFDPLPV